MKDGARAIPFGSLRRKLRTLQVSIAAAAVMSGILGGLAGAGIMGWFSFARMTWLTAATCNLADIVEAVGVPRPQIEAAIEGGKGRGLRALVTGYAILCVNDPQEAMVRKINCHELLALSSLATADEHP